MNLEERILLLSKNNVEKVLNQKLDVKGFKEREIWKLSKSKNNLIIIGLRRIGKTELLNQIIKDKLKNKITISNKKELNNSKETFKDEKIKNLKSSKELNPILLKKDSETNNDFSKILYLKLDSIELISLEEKYKKEIFPIIKILIKKKKINLLLIDEIQTLNNWNYFIKDIFDDFGDQVQIYVTGSNSNLLSNSSEHAVGRANIRFFGVLSFEESKIVKENNNLATYIDFNHFPEYDIVKYEEDMWQLVIEKAFDSSNSRRDTLLKVLFQIIENVGCETNQTKISKKSGVNKTHINKYINDLIDSQLVFKIQNFKKSNQNIKLYPLIPGLYNLLKGENFYNLEKHEKGHIFEQFILIQILSKKTKFNERMNIKFYREKINDNIYEIDFVINDKLIEVKYSKSIHNLHKYIQVVKSLKMKKLYFIYLGETKSKNLDGLQIQFINWKEIKKYGF